MEFFFASPLLLLLWFVIHTSSYNVFIHAFCVYKGLLVHNNNNNTRMYDLNFIIIHGMFGLYFRCVNYTHAIETLTVAKTVHWCDNKAEPCKEWNSTFMVARILHHNAVAGVARERDWRRAMMQRTRGKKREKNKPMRSSILVTNKLFDITLYCRDFFNFKPKGMLSTDVTCFHLTIYLQFLHEFSQFFYGHFSILILCCVRVLFSNWQPDSYGNVINKYLTRGNSSWHVPKMSIRRFVDFQNFLVQKLKIRRIFQMFLTK